MTVELKNGNDILQIPCSESAFFAGMTIRNDKNCKQVNVINADGDMTAGFKNIDCVETEHKMHDGSMLYLYCYTSDDPVILEIVKRFKGLKMLEVSDDQIEITVTL